MRKVLIIAEAGVNHNGCMQTAKQLINKAAASGADVVKFQAFIADKLVTTSAEKADYQKCTTGIKESQFEMLKKLELDEVSHKELIEYSDQIGIKFMSTAFDTESAKMLAKLGLQVFKIPSGEITNLPYLRIIGSFGREVIISTGMSFLKEIKDAVNILYDSGAKKVTVLHCNTEYPTPMEDVNLLAMNTIRDEVNVEIGYSDHTNGIEVSIAAVAMGATVIEKHFTLDREMEGPDHKASLEPDELKQMVKAIRNIEKAIGDGVKKPSDSEKKNIEIVRKSIVTTTKIMKGEVFTEENITTKRPGNGISPMKWFEVLGQVAKRDFEEDQLVEL